jgi:hypothetical protein
MRFFREKPVKPTPDVTKERQFKWRDVHVRVYFKDADTYVSMWNDRYMLTREMPTLRAVNLTESGWDFVFTLMRQTLRSVSEAPKL